MKSRLLTLTLMIALAALSRILPHPSNFAPITGIALLAGTYFSDKRLAFLVPLLAMLLSDWMIGFHGLVPLTYASFALIVLLGFRLREKFSVSRLAGTTLASSLLYFVITNLGVWAFESLYPKTLAGLVTCFIAALPFLNNTLAGDAFYTVILFGGFSLATRMVPALRQTASS